MCGDLGVGNGDIIKLLVPLLSYLKNGDKNTCIA